MEHRAELAVELKPVLDLLQGGPGGLPDGAVGLRVADDPPEKRARLRRFAGAQPLSGCNAHRRRRIRADIDRRKRKLHGGPHIPVGFALQRGTQCRTKSRVRGFQQAGRRFEPCAAVGMSQVEAGERLADRPSQPVVDLDLLQRFRRRRPGLFARNRVEQVEFAAPLGHDEQLLVVLAVVELAIDHGREDRRGGRMSGRRQRLDAGLSLPGRLLGQQDKRRIETLGRAAAAGSQAGSGGEQDKDQTEDSVADRQGSTPPCRGKAAAAGAAAMRVRTSAFRSCRRPRDRSSRR